METVIEPTKLITWTDERTTKLKALFDEGLSCSMIAARIGGVTRSAIIGKLHRMKLSNPRPTVTMGRSPRTESVKGLRDPVIRIRPNSEYRLQPDRIVVVPLCVELIDLEPHHCRYPYGDSRYVFCGHHKQSGSSYCPPHFALTWSAGR